MFYPLYAIRYTLYERRATSDERRNGLYICRESSTNRPIFMQNKPNLLDAQMNITSAITMNYINEL